MGEVMEILKKRIYYGHTHSTQIADLKQAEKEILDWADGLLVEQEQRLLAHTKLPQSGKEKK